MNGDQGGSLLAWLVGLVLAPILIPIGWVWTVASSARASAADAHKDIARLDERNRETKEAIDRVETYQREGFDGVHSRLDTMTTSFENRLYASRIALTKRIDDFLNGN